MAREGIRGPYEEFVGTPTLEGYLTLVWKGMKNVFFVTNQIWLRVQIAKRRIEVAEGFRILQSITRVNRILILFIMVQIVIVLMALFEKEKN